MTSEKGKKEEKKKHGSLTSSEDLGVIFIIYINQSWCFTQFLPHLITNEDNTMK